MKFSALPFPVGPVHFVGIGGIHLLGMLVAAGDILCRTDSLPKWLKKSRSVLGRVRQNSGVDVAAGFERVTNSPDSPIHHVRGGNHMSACVGVAKCLTNQYIHRFIVNNITSIVHQTILAVSGVRIERHIRDDSKFRTAFAQCPYRPRY